MKWWLQIVERINYKLIYGHGQQRNLNQTYQPFKCQLLFFNENSIKIHRQNPFFLPFHIFFLQLRAFIGFPNFTVIYTWICFPSAVPSPVGTEQIFYILLPSAAEMSVSHMGGACAKCEKHNTIDSHVCWCVVCNRLLIFLNILRNLLKKYQLELLILPWVSLLWVI